MKPAPGRWPDMQDDIAGERDDCPKSGESSPKRYVTAQIFYASWMRSQALLARKLEQKRINPELW